MDELNYYLLLELSYDPPEENADKIEEAIRKKQAKWSKLRNHPTQGTLAQKYIGLIPEIQKVMTDESLRKKEAQKARQLSIIQAKANFSKIDKNLELLIKKGHIAPEEVDKLAQLHSVNKDVILDRVKKRIVVLKIGGEIEKLVRAGKATPKNLQKLGKQFSVDAKRIEDIFLNREKEKKEEIEGYLNRCRVRGFITKSEVKTLSNMFVVSESELLKNISYPVKPDKDAALPSPPPAIDPTIEKLIIDNLKIINKRNLYDFLEISPDVGMKILHNRVHQKEAEVRDIAHKDAVTTASGVLMGHCSTLFKSEKMRDGYDRSLILKELDEYIEVAGIKDDLRPEYLYFLLRIAIRKGMDLPDASDYIEQFGKGKGWKVQSGGKKSASKRKSGPVKKIIGLAAIVLTAAGLWFGFQVFQSNQAEKEFREMIVRVDSQPDLKKKIGIINGYIGITEEEEYIRQAEEKKYQVQESIVKAEFQSVLDKAEPLYKKGDFKRIRSLYTAFLSRHPEGAYSDSIKRKISDLSGEAADSDYEKLASLPDDHDKRLRAYRHYLARYPKGPHTGDVKKKIDETESLYIDDLKSNFHKYEQDGEWDKCIALCNTFIKDHPNSEKKEEVLGYKKKYQNRIQSQKDLAGMKEKAKAKGRDYEAARLIYLEYLEANPELPSYFKKLIVKEVEVLDKRIDWQMLSEKEWEEAHEYSGNAAASLSKRIQKLERFTNKFPETPHLKAAGEIIARLKSEKAIEDERLREKNELRKWQEVVKYAKNNGNPTSSKIRKVDQYLRAHSTGKYRKKASVLLESLKQQQALEAKRKQQEQGVLQRKRAFRRQVQSFIRKAGNRFSDNGNGTFTDRQSGLTWYIYNSRLDLNRCVTYQASIQYTKSLNAGGHNDWRLPTVGELESLLKAGPVFPSGGANWLWTYETFWHGWNKMSYGFSLDGSQWKKNAVDVGKCGTGLAVRR